MSLACRTFIALALLTPALPALAMPVCTKWEDDGPPSPPTSTTLDYGNGVYLCATTVVRTQKCVAGATGTRTTADTTHTDGKCPGAAPTGDTSSEFGSEFVLDLSGVGIAVLDVDGRDGTVFDVYDELGDWITAGTVGQPVEVPADSVLVISAPAGAVDAITAAPL